MNLSLKALHPNTVNTHPSMEKACRIFGCHVYHHPYPCNLVRQGNALLQILFLLNQLWPFYSASLSGSFFYYLFDFTPPSAEITSMKQILDPSFPKWFLRTYLCREFFFSISLQKLKEASQVSWRISEAYHKPTAIKRVHPSSQNGWSQSLFHSDYIGYRAQKILWGSSRASLNLCFRNGLKILLLKKRYLAGKYINSCWNNYRPSIYW